MTQQYTPVTWQDETTSQQGTLINAERLNQMQTAHHFADGFEEVDAIPTADPSVAYHKIVYCTADSTFYRWDGEEWTADIDDDTKRLLLEHEADHSNPHQVTKAQVGLGNADNTSDLNKPISTATQTALDTKVDKLTAGSGASAYTHNGASQGEMPIRSDVVASAIMSRDADGYAHSRTPASNSDDTTVATTDWVNDAVQAEAGIRSAADSQLGGRIDAHLADHSNPHQVTKAQVGLGNVDNTSDADKPVSTAQAAAIADLGTALGGRIDQEIGNRVSEDAALSNRIDTLGGQLTATESNLQTQINARVRIADGVTAWSANVTYGANSFCQYNGTLYRSLVSSNTGNPPTSSPAAWAEYAPGSGSSTGLIGPDNTYTGNIGNGSSTTINVVHNLGTYDVLWAIWSNSDKGVAGVKAVKTSANILTLTFASAPAADEYRILVFRPGDAARIYTQTFTAAASVVITHNLGRLPSGISVYSPTGQRVGVRMVVDTTTATLSFAGYDSGNYTIMVIA